MDAQSQWTGLDAARLERIGDHLERNYIGNGKVVGCQVSVARHGHIAYQTRSAEAALERASPSYSRGRWIWGGERSVKH